MPSIADNSKTTPRQDSAKLDALEKAGKLKRIAFTDRAEMKKLLDPVMAAYAKEIGADFRSPLLSTALFCVDGQL